MQFLTILSTAAVVIGTALAKPAGKPTGGPASAKVTIYSGPYQCTDPNTPPPTDGSAGTAKVVNVTENTCTVVDIPFQGALTSVMTANPKTGTTFCYIQMFTQQGCGLTLQNQYHGFPYNGISTGSSVGCASPPVMGYGAVQIVCG